MRKLNLTTEFAPDDGAAEEEKWLKNKLEAPYKKSNDREFEVIITTFDDLTLIDSKKCFKLNENREDIIFLISRSINLKNDLFNKGEKESSNSISNIIVKSRYLDKEMKFKYLDKYNNFRIGNKFQDDAYIRDFKTTINIHHVNKGSKIIFYLERFPFSTLIHRKTTNKAQNIGVKIGDEDLSAWGNENNGVIEIEIFKGNDNNPILTLEVGEDVCSGKSKDEQNVEKEEMLNNEPKMSNFDESPSFSEEIEEKLDDNLSMEESIPEFDVFKDTRAIENNEDIKNFATLYPFFNLTHRVLPKNSFPFNRETKSAAKYTWFIGKGGDIVSFEEDSLLKIIAENNKIFLLPLVEGLTLNGADLKSEKQIELDQYNKQTIKYNENSDFYFAVGDFWNNIDSVEEKVKEIGLESSHILTYLDTEPDIYSNLNSDIVLIGNSQYLSERIDAIKLLMLKSEKAKDSFSIQASNYNALFRFDEENKQFVFYNISQSNGKLITVFDKKGNIKNVLKGNNKKSYKEAYSLKGVGSYEERESNIITYFKSNRDEFEHCVLENGDKVIIGIHIYEYRYRVKK